MFKITCSENMKLSNIKMLCSPHRSGGFGPVFGPIPVSASVIKHAKT